MADVSKSLNSKRSSKFETAMWASKLVLLCVGFISTLFVLKVAIIPYTFDFIITTLPGFWIPIRGWLSPPYIYIILNFIIIAIAASSTFQHQNTTTTTTATKPSSSPIKQIPSKGREHNLHDDDNEFVSHNDADLWKEFRNETNQVADAVSELSSFEKSDENKPSMQIIDHGQQNERTEQEEEKEKVKTEGEEEKDSSLEETWKLIMEGKEKSKTRQLKKSETWDSPPKVLHKANELADDGVLDDPVAWARRELRKSDTFNDSVSMKREISMSHEELNRKAEEFIKKFNYEMRLQRLESEQRFVEMVNRGVKC